MVFMDWNKDTDQWQISSLEIILLYLHIIYRLMTQAQRYAT
jgi:hypothetical protein